MLFTCPHCATRYDEAETVLAQHEFMVRCYLCQRLFRLQLVATELPLPPVTPEPDEVPALGELSDVRHLFDDKTEADRGEAPSFDDQPVDDPDIEPVDNSPSVELEEFNDDDMFSDLTRQVTPSRDLLIKALPDLDEAPSGNPVKRDKG